MKSEILVERVDASDVDGTVSHIDELDDGTRGDFIHLLERTSPTAEVDETVASRLVSRKYIKYIHYYRVTSGAPRIRCD
jgi:hypothetical protein